MKHRKKLKMAKVRPEEQAYLERWKGVKSAPSVWEKMDQDPVYEQAVKLRNSDMGESLGTTWGQARGPK
jgi:hypothetical protein